MDATLKLRGIRRAYKDVVAVANLDLDLVPGQVYGLLGPNGSGKSTTLRVSLGLATPDAGTVALFGASPGVSQRRRVGLVPEQRSLTAEEANEAEIDTLLASAEAGMNEIEAHKDKQPRLVGALKGLAGLPFGGGPVGKTRAASLPPESAKTQADRLNRFLSHAG